MRHVRLVMTSVAAAGVWPLISLADCPPPPPVWARGFNYPGIEGSIWTANVLDDDGPSGPNLSRLYLGGSFSGVNGRLADSLVRWNPDLLAQGFKDCWEPVFHNPPIAGGTVKHVMLFDEDGESGPKQPKLMILGSIGAPYARIADAGNWIAPPGLTTASGSSLADGISVDPDGPGPQPHETFLAGFAGLFRWTGTRFDSVGGSAVHGSDVFAVFDVDGPGRQPPAIFNGFPGVRRWDGTRWTSYGLDADTIAIADFDGPGPLPENLVAASYSGLYLMEPVTLRWKRLASAGFRDPSSLLMFDEDGPGPLPASLVQCGSSIQSGLSGIALRFDGQGWRSLGTSVSSGSSSAGVTYDFDGPLGPRPTELICVGAVTLAGNRSMRGAASFDPALSPPGWRPLFPGNGIRTSGKRRSAAIDPDGPGPLPRQIYVPTGSNGVGTAWGNGLVSRLEYAFARDNDPSDWTNLGVTAFPDNFFVPLDIAGFDFDGPGPENESIVVIRPWRATSQISTNQPFVGRIHLTDDAPAWQLLGNFDYVSGGNLTGSLAVLDEDGDGPAPATLYVRGPFTRVDGALMGQLVRWVAGSSGWSPPPFPNPAGQYIAEIFVLDLDGEHGPTPPRLHVVTQTATATFVIHRLLPSGWQALGGPLSALSITSMAVFDEDGEGPLPSRMYAAGPWFGPATNRVSRVVYFDGINWVPIVPPGPASSQSVTALTVFDDDGPGPARPSLFASGQFTRGSTTHVGLATLVDGDWVPITDTNSASNTAAALTTFDPDGAGPRPAALIFFGDTAPIPDRHSTGISIRLIPPGLADHNADWSITVQDVFDFLNDYFIGHASADIDRSGQVALSDIFAYLRTYLGDCN